MCGKKILLLLLLLCSAQLQLQTSPPKSFDVKIYLGPQSYSPGGYPQHEVWAFHNTNAPFEIWTIQACNELGDWFSIPGYKDETGRVSAVTPDDPDMRFFRAKRIR